MTTNTTDEVCPPAKIRLSWSRLKAYEACHKRVDLQMKGFKSKIIDGRAFLPGTLADRAMRAWLEEGVFDSGGMKRFIPKIWEEHTGKESEYTIKWRGNPNDDKKAVLGQVSRALDVLEPILMEKVVPYPFMPEFRFTSVINIPYVDGSLPPVGIEIFGAVDVAVKMDESRYGLYDLKITENDSYIRSTLAQLIFYDLAFQGHTGLKPVEHEFWAPLMPLMSPPKPSVIPLNVTKTERMQMISRIINYCHGVWRDEWELTPDKNQCFNCPVKQACPRWVTQISQDEQGKNRTTFKRADFDLMQEKESKDR